MSLTSQCPKCEKQVMVPEGVAADAVVRCPLCQEEYPVGDALAKLPPTLIVVSAPEPPVAVAAPSEAVPPAEMLFSDEIASPLLGEPAPDGVSFGEDDGIDLHSIDEPIGGQAPEEPEAAPEGEADESGVSASLWGGPAIHDIAEELPADASLEGEPLEGEPLEVEPATGDEGPWNQAWAPRGEAAEGEEEPIALADDEGQLGVVDFAAITSKAPAGAPAEGVHCSRPSITPCVRKASISFSTCRSAP